MVKLLSTEKQEMLVIRQVRTTLSSQILRVCLYFTYRAYFIHLPLTRIKRPERKTDYSPQISPNDHTWRKIPLPHTPLSLRTYLLKQSDNFSSLTFTLSYNKISDYCKYRRAKYFPDSVFFPLRKDSHFHDGIWCQMKILLSAQFHDGVNMMS